MKDPKKGILRATLALDGGLLTGSGKPSGKCLRPEELENAAELHLTVLPVIAGGAVPTLSGMPEGFLPKDLRFQLVSASRRGDALTLRYCRRRGVRERRA